MKKLNQVQRIIAAAIYLAIIFIITYCLGGNIKELLMGQSDESIWFLSGVLLIIMGQCVTEPFFSTPADAFANSLTAILALVAINDKTVFSGFWLVFLFSCIVGLLSLFAIMLRKKENKISKMIYYLVNKIGSSKFLFSVIYLTSVYNYFFKTNRINYLIGALFIWILIVCFNAVERLISFISSFLAKVKEKPTESIYGDIVKNSDKTVTIQVENDFIDNKKVNNGYVIIKSNESYLVGRVIKTRNHSDCLWTEAILLENNGHPIKINKQDIIPRIQSAGDKSALFVEESELTPSALSQIKADYLTCNLNRFVGNIRENSDINLIYFSILNNGDVIKEGSIIEVNIKGKMVLYQVINGITKELNDDGENKFGIILGKARKLGEYIDEKKELVYTPWVPNENERVYILENNLDINLEKIAKEDIGRLPDTAMSIPIKDINSLTTHNTAILGILGVGKSCLTFELIRKIINSSDCKIVCIDITNQYYSENGLFNYVQKNVIKDDMSKEHLESLITESQKKGTRTSPATWGNVEYYRSIVNKYINWFYESDNKVWVINPDNHAVKKAASSFNIEEAVDLTVVEKTRIISEAILKYCMEQGQTETARCCVVFEEAHSLVPEWNSVSSSGDQSATNGTAKVILQGRKYGLGCILITQRTANITKSILNQCNTIFALRVFDDTGKQFLENYIGSDYSSVLPTLEERHAIVTGKALNLKQPVVIQLNDKKYFRVEE